jgi:septal ring factor EnvC (AmiA/AmiB activator)
MPESSRRRDRFSFEVVPDEPLTSSNPALRNSQNDGRSNASQRLSNLVASKKGGRSAHISEAANSVSDKVMPLLSDKLMDLAKSFDEELQDKENSQREAKRILQSTNIELSKVQNQLAELEAEGKEDEAMVQNETNQLARTQQHVISLVEQQQALLLAEAIEAAGLEDAPNGTDDHEEDAEMMRQLLQELYDAQKRRQQLVSEYVEALGAAGVGEKAERYRTLTAKCIGVSPEEVDQQLDSLVEVLDEDGKDGDGVEMEM